MIFDEREAKRRLPVRPPDGNKGTFGKVLVIAGSDIYPGAAFLSVEAALRSGVGYVHFCGAPALVDKLLPHFPEVIYHPVDLSADISSAVSLSLSVNATLFGPGAGGAPHVRVLALALMQNGNTPLVLDADALNALHEDDFALCKRPTLVTPHPKEFERLTGVTVTPATRLTDAAAFAKRTGVSILLKGKGTVTTDGTALYENPTGNTALSKGGSGDVLAGLIAGLCASGTPLPDAGALGAYLHGKAAETLSENLSPFGVTPSDLPTAIAREIAKL